jgi:hypothetical protein
MSAVLPFQQVDYNGLIGTRTPDLLLKLIRLFQPFFGGHAGSVGQTK